jgi:sigma-E factor negative regulatory protein RseB
MSRLRLLVLVAGAGTLLAGMQGGAAARTGTVPDPPASGIGETRALELLSVAAQAGRTRTYRGTQYVSTWRADTASSDVADIRHTPATGSVVQVRPTADRTEPADDAQSVTSATDLDVRLLQLLADHYQLQQAGNERCTGRTAHVVEALRPGVDGPAAVAGRFWVDAASGLVLRREVFDTGGRLVRSSAFTDLTIDPAPHAAGSASSASPAGASIPAALAAAPGALPTDALDALRRDGWQIPADLTGDLQLFDARVRSHDGRQVLHLSYSDGLSTLSLFAQRGRLGSGPMHGFAKQKVGSAGSAPVWVRTANPERVVWGGGGQVFTLLSDAPPESVRAAVTALPHDRAPRTGLLARLQRGLARLGSWLNPFG